MSLRKILGIAQLAIGLVGTLYFGISARDYYLKAFDQLCQLDGRAEEKKQNEDLTREQINQLEAELRKAKDFVTYFGTNSNKLYIFGCLCGASAGLVHLGERTLLYEKSRQKK